MTSLHRVFVTGITIASLALASAAQAGTCTAGCGDVNLVSRRYNLDEGYYMHEPSHSDKLSDTQTYAIYRAGEYPSGHSPVASFQLTNLHTVCCSLINLPEARGAVRLTLGDQQVDLCVYRPAFSNYAADLAVTFKESKLSVHLFYPESAGTCLDSGGEFNVAVQRDWLGNTTSRSAPLIPGLKDVTTVQLSETVVS